MKNILLTVDFDVNENIILEQAQKMAKAFDAKVWVVHIATPNSDFVGYFDPNLMGFPDPHLVGYNVGPEYINDMQDQEFKKEHRQLQDYTAKFEKNGIAAEALLVQGATTEMIIQESQKLKVDLIITGHHEHGFLYNAIIGSTSSQILKHSKIPVLIVPVE